MIMNESLHSICSSIDQLILNSTATPRHAQQSRISDLHTAIRQLPQPSSRADLRTLALGIARPIFALVASDAPAFALLELLPTVFAADARAQLHVLADVHNDDDEQSNAPIYVDVLALQFSAACAPRLLDALLDCAHVIVAVDESIRRRLTELRFAFDASSRVAVVRHCFLIAQRLACPQWTRLAIGMLADVSDLNDRSALLYVVELALQHSLALSRLVLADVASRAVAQSSVNAVVDLPLLLLLAGSTSAHRLTVASTASVVLLAALNRFDRDLYRSYTTDNVAASSSASTRLPPVDDSTLLARAIVRGIAASTCAHRLLPLAQCLAQFRWRAVHSRSLQSTLQQSGGASPARQLNAEQSRALRHIGAMLLREMFVAHEGARSTVVASIAQPLVELRDGADAETIESAAAHIAVLEALVEQHVALCLPHSKAVFDIVSQLFVSVAEAGSTAPLVRRAVSGALSLCRASQSMFDDTIVLLRKWIRARDSAARALALSTAVEILARDLLPYSPQCLEQFASFLEPAMPLRLRNSEALITDDDVRPEWRDLPPVVVLALVQCVKESAAHGDVSSMSNASSGVAGDDGDTSAGDLFAMVARELAAAPLGVRSNVYAALDNLRIVRSSQSSAQCVVPAAPLLAATKALLVRQLARCFRLGDDGTIQLSLEHCFDDDRWGDLSTAVTPSKSERRRSGAPPSKVSTALAVREDVAQLARVLLAFDSVAPDTVASRTARAMLDSLEATLLDPQFVQRVVASTLASKPTTVTAAAHGKEPADQRQQWLALFANELDLVRCAVEHVPPRARAALIAPLYDVFGARFDGERRAPLLEMAALVGAVAGIDGALTVIAQPDMGCASAVALDMSLRAVLNCKQLSPELTEQCVALALGVFRRRFDGVSSSPSELQLAAGVAVSPIQLECRALQCLAHVCTVGERDVCRRALVGAFVAGEQLGSALSLACALTTQLHARVSEGVELSLLQAYVNASLGVAIVARGDDDAPAQLDSAAREMVSILDEFLISHATVIRLLLRFVFACAQAPLALAVARRIIGVWSDVLDCPDDREEGVDAAIVEGVSFGDSDATRRAALASLMQHLSESLGDVQWMMAALDLLGIVFWRVLSTVDSGQKLRVDEDDIGDEDDDENDENETIDDHDEDEDSDDDDECLDRRLMSDGTIGRSLALLTALVRRASELLTAGPNNGRTDAVLVRVADLTAKLLVAHRRRHVLVGHNVQQRLPKLMQALEEFAIDVRDCASDGTPTIDELKRAVGAFERDAAVNDAADVKALANLRKATSVVSRKRGRQLRSRNAWIDAALADENGNDTFADLEDFVVVDE
jgi:hypothetical protein